MSAQDSTLVNLGQRGVYLEPAVTPLSFRRGGQSDRTKILP